MSFLTRRLKAHLDKAYDDGYNAGLGEKEQVYDEGFRKGYEQGFALAWDKGFKQGQSQSGIRIRADVSPGDSDQNTEEVVRTVEDVAEFLAQTGQELP